VAISGALQGCQCKKRRQARQKLAQCVPVRDLLTWQSLALFRLPMHKAPSGATEVSPVRSRVPHRGTRDKRWERIFEKSHPHCRRRERSVSEATIAKKRCITVLILLTFLTSNHSQTTIHPACMPTDLASRLFTATSLRVAAKRMVC
jgi:hypothetical protein